MSKFIAERTYRMTDEEGNLVVSYVVKGGDKRAASLAVDETKRAEKITVEVKPYKSNRTLEQNRLLWALLGKMAEAVSGKRDRMSTEECYISMLEEANVKYDFLLAMPETEEALKEGFRAVKRVGERLYNGRKMNVYKVFIGSSKYDKEEMSALIETTLDKLAELGVYDSEIETAREAYYGDSILQKDRRCYVCGAREGLHRHHVFYGTGNRWRSEQCGFVVYLCGTHHNLSENGVHFDKALDLKIKRDFQRKFEETHTRDEFIKIVGKNYL